MTIKKVTAFSVHQTGVGQQVAFTYSIVDEMGPLSPKIRGRRWS